MGETIEAAAPKKPRVAMWIATGFGLGYLPIAPGTWGSLGGVVMFLGSIALIHAVRWGLMGLDFLFPARASVSLDTVLREIMIAFFAAKVLLAFAVGLLGVWAARHAARYFGKSDPGQVVIDEISGQQITYLPLVALSLADVEWKYLLLGFILFRIFDIVKPWPARAAEKWPHGWGIMADDWFAGVYAALVLWLAHRLAWLG
jgi:phosphatidylglycerophosphatase A